MTRWRDWWTRLTCALKGHDPVLRLEYGQVRVRCARCGRASSIFERNVG